MHLGLAVIAPCLIAALSSCAAARNESSDGGPEREPASAGLAALQATAPSTEPGELGEMVQDLGDKLWIVFQDKQGTHWFGSDGEGVYRVDGRNIVRYTTKDGLCNDQVRQILEDEAGNIYVNTCGGISKFDGQRFSTLVPVESSTSAGEWKLEPGDLWFKGGQNDNGPYRYDGQALHRLEFPEHDLEHAFNSKFPGVPHSPYAIFSTYKDSRGSIWFGTSNFGACRYDGKAFTWVSDPELTALDVGSVFGVRGIVEDQEGKFWLSNTLHRYDVHPTDSTEQTAAATGYRKEPGMLDPGAQDEGQAYFTAAIRDDQGALWMSSMAREFGGTTEKA